MKFAVELLTSSDEAFLCSVRESIVQGNIEFLHFFCDVVLRDFPPQVFLGRVEFIYDLLENESLSLPVSLASIHRLTERVLRKVIIQAQEQPVNFPWQQVTASEESMDLPTFVLSCLKKGMSVLSAFHTSPRTEAERGAASFLIRLCCKLAEFVIPEKQVIAGSASLKNLLQDVFHASIKGLESEDAFIADYTFQTLSFLFLLLHEDTAENQSSLSSVSFESAAQWSVVDEMPPLLISALRSYCVCHEPRAKHYLSASLQIIKDAGILPLSFFADLASVRSLPPEVSWTDMEGVLKEPHLLCIALASANPRPAYHWIRLELSSTRQEKSLNERSSMEPLSTTESDAPPFEDLLLNRDVLYQMIGFGSRHHDVQIRSLCLDCLHLIFLRYKEDPRLWMALTDLMPYLQTLTSFDTHLGRELIRLTSSSFPLSSSSSSGWLRFVLRSLFFKESNVRNEAAETLNFLLLEEPESYSRLPSVPLKFDADDFVRILYPRLDLNAKPAREWNEETLEFAFRHLEIVINPLEPLRYSALAQVTQLISDHGYSSDLFQTQSESLNSLLSMFHSCLKLNPDEAVNLDFYPLLLEIIVQIVRGDRRIRLDLATNPSMYYTLLRGLLVFKDNWTVSAMLVFVLGVLLFAEVIVDSSMDRSKPLMQCVPQFLADAFLLPFESVPIHLQSPYGPQGGLETLSTEEERRYAAESWKARPQNLSDRIKMCINEFEVSTTKEDRRIWMDRIEIVYNLWRMNCYYFGEKKTNLLPGECWTRIALDDTTKGLYVRCPHLSETLSTEGSFLENLDTKVLSCLKTARPSGISHVIRCLDIKQETDFQDLADLQNRLQYLNNVLSSDGLSVSAMEGSFWKTMTSAIHYLRELIRSFHMSNSFMGRGITLQAVAVLVQIVRLALNRPNECSNVLSSFMRFFLENGSLGWTKSLWSACDPELKRLSLSFMCLLAQANVSNLNRALQSKELQLWTSCMEFVRNTSERCEIKIKAAVLLRHLFSLGVSSAENVSGVGGILVTRQFLVDLIVVLERNCSEVLSQEGPVVGKFGANSIIPLLLSLSVLLCDLCRFFPKEMQPVVKESKMAVMLNNCLAHNPSHPGNAVIAQLLLKICLEIDPRTTKKVKFSLETIEDTLKAVDPSDMAVLLELFSLKPAMNGYIESVIRESLESKNPDLSRSAAEYLLQFLLLDEAVGEISDPDQLLQAVLIRWRSQPSEIFNRTLSMLLRQNPKLRQRAILEHDLPCVLLRFTIEVASKRRRRDNDQILSLLLVLQSCLFDVHFNSPIRELSKFPVLVKQLWEINQIVHVSLLKALLSFSKNFPAQVPECEGWSELTSLVKGCDCLPVLACQVLAQLTSSLEVRTMLLSGNSLLDVFQMVPLQSYLLLIYAISMYEDGRSKLPSKLCFDDFLPLFGEESDVELLALGYSIMRNLAFFHRNKGLILHNEMAMKFLSRGLRDSNPAVSLPALATVWTLGSNRSRGKVVMREQGVTSIIEQKDDSSPHQELIATLKEIFRTSGTLEKRKSKLL